MRKKSHISLARYIVYNLEEAELLKHRKAFYLGSILPDCKPSFLTTRHEFHGTFEKMKQEINRLTTNYTETNFNFRAFCRDLGQIIHYIADYFTFPHNITYDGSLKDHCMYEKDLKFALLDYIKNGEAEKRTRKMHNFETPEALCSFISESHNEYLKVKRTIQEDCKYIVSLCHTVAYSVMRLFKSYQNVLLNCA